MVRNFQHKNRNRFRRARGNRFLAPALFASQIRQVRSPHLPAWVLKLIVLAFFSIGLAYFFFLSPYFAIRDVMVEGNEYISADRIGQYIPMGNNIFRLDIRETKYELLDNIPEIKDLAIYRGIPNAVKIVVLERDGKLVWQSGGNNYLVSSLGEVAKKLEVGEDNPLIPHVVDTKNLPVTVGERLVSPNFVNFISLMYGRFSEDINIKPVAFSVEETTFDVNLQTEAGFYVKLNTLRPVQSQLDNLKRVLTAKRDEVHEYVDLRIDGWAYYK